MANLKEIRNRIGSVQSTKQVTSAMKMVSAAKLRKATDAIIKMRPYANKMHEILSHVSESVDLEGNPYQAKREVNKVLIFVVASNRGLCGAFNSNAVKFALKVAEENYSEQLARGTAVFVPIGKKAMDILKSRNVVSVDEKLSGLFDNLVFENVAKTAEKYMKEFVDGKYDRIDFVYNQFKNAASQLLIHEQFLPIKIDKSASEFHADYIFEPSMEEIAETLIPRSLKIQFFKVLRDSFASEQGARMTAMHQATDNATELLKQLKLTYNKARQASITTEILEIVSGAEALKG